MIAHRLATRGQIEIPQAGMDGAHRCMAYDRGVPHT